jgi:hypothetical protein
MSTRDPKDDDATIGGLAASCEAAALAARVLAERGFEPHVTMSVAAPRSAICVITVGVARTPTPSPAASPTISPSASQAAAQTAGVPTRSLAKSMVDLILGVDDAAA